MAQLPAAVGTIHTIELPGGVEGLRRAIGDRRPTPPATVGIEIARRFHGGTPGTASDDPILADLRAWVRTCVRLPGCGAPELAPDQVPLPGDPAFWHDVVFDERVPPTQVMLAILDQREAALLYTALLSMREEVRAWLLARPGLVRGLRGSDAGRLLVAAPYLRIDGGQWQWPGGSPAAPVWAALMGVRPGDPEASFLAVLRAHDGLLTYLMEVVATLSPHQQAAALSLADPDESRRIAAGAELLDGLRSAVRGWHIHEHPFSRPSHDPAFLLSQLPSGADGRLALPGGRAFWDLVFDEGPLGPREADARAAWGEPARVTPGWLVDRVWTGIVAEEPIRYEQVLFASRRLAGATALQAADVATVLRGYARYPQLLRVLDRLDVDDVTRLARIVRRAEALAQAGSDWRSRAALLRWQSLLAGLEAMVRFGAVEPDELSRALDALADSGHAGASRGSRVRALVGGLGLAAVAGDVPQRSVEQALLARLTRSRLAASRSVTWEGLAYRLDFGAAERDRLARVRGRDALPRLDAAWVAFAAAEQIAAAPDAAAVLAVLETLVAATRLDRPPAVDEDLGREARLAAATARALLARSGTGRDWPQIRAALDDLGEALASEALVEIAYALGMGWAEDLPLTALAASRRHVFVRRSPAGMIDASWLAPAIAAARGEPWRVVGSLLGLDGALAPVALRRPSMKPFGAAPALNTGDRHWLVSTVAALDRRSFTDEAQARVVALLSRGRERLRGVEGGVAARAAAEQAGASPLRQTLAAWIAEVNPRTLVGVFSMTEIVWLGADGGPVPDVLAGWGNAQTPISGRLAAGPLPSLPWERYAGRSARLVSCALPDLQLSLAVRLADLGLPALLVPDLMPSATFELVNTAAPRHADDFAALAEHVRLMDPDAVERYLGLLTTAGPLRADAASRTP